MYKDFFGLKEPPFNLTPDPRFFYMSRRHQEALASLVYGIRERKGFILLTGEIGAGKTTLCRAFLNEMNAESTNVALVLNSFLNDVELLQTINDEFGLPSSSTSKKLLIDELNRFLLEEANKGKTTVLIIDEAQNLSPAVLEQVRMLSNLETENCKLIQIVLMGQPELSRILDLPELEQLAQRIMVRCHIAPLERQEVYHYIRHRLEVAGARINIALSPAALNRIHYYSGGIPRRINVLCDCALLAAYVAGQFQIDAKIIAKAEKDLMGQGMPGRRRGPRWSISRSAVLTAMGTLVLGGIIGGSVWLNMHMEVISARIPLSRPRPVSALPPVATARPLPPTPSPTQRPKPTATPIPAPTAIPLPSVSDLSTTATVSASEQWTYDYNGIVRVSDPDFAQTASLITVGKLWRFPVPLDKFPKYDKSTILGINLQHVFSGPQINLRSFESTSKLRDVMTLDLPLVLQVEEPTGRLAPTVVLLGVSGNICTLADPRLGRIRLGLPELEKMTRRITVFYLDPDRLTTLSPGDQSKSVESLRLFLAEQGVWSGKPTRVFNADVEEAIKRFQTGSKQVATGRLDGPTAARISAKRQVFRPRLLKSGTIN